MHYDLSELRPFHHTVLRNSFQFQMHRQCQDVMRKVQPDLICPGHREALRIDPIKINTYCDFIDQQERAYRELMGELAAQQIDLFWARFSPYQAQATSGKKIEYPLLLRNNFGRKAVSYARLLAVDGHTVVDESDITLEVEQRGELTLHMPLAPDLAAGRHLIAAEILIAGVSQGSVVEALIDVV